MYCSVDKNQSSGVVSGSGGGGGGGSGSGNAGGAGSISASSGGGSSGGGGGSVGSGNGNTTTPLQNNTKSVKEGVTMREKKGGALQKLKKRLSHSFGRLSISREENDDSTQHNNHHHPHHLHHHGHNRGSKVPFNGYTSEEYLDRLEPNGNIPDKTYNKRKYPYP